MRNNPTHLIIHHTAVKSDSHQLFAVNNYHKSIGFPKSSLGWYGGYHWFIEKDGTKKRYRKDNEVGAHTLKGWNTKSIGVCLAGNFNIETPSEAQIRSLRNLIKKYDLDYKLHREADSRRTCPGKFFNKDILFLAEDSEDIIKREELQKEVDRLRKENSSLRQTIQFITKLLKK